MSRGTPSEDDVLQAFAVEPNHDQSTLERYLAAYPSYAGGILDLARELLRDMPDSDFELSAVDVAAVDAAWLKHSSVAAAVARSLADITVAEQRAAAAALGLPRQVITAFKDGRVQKDTIPAPFMRRLADALNWSSASLTNALDSLAAPPTLVRSYKAENKPVASAQVALEQILTDAGVSPEKRAELLSEGS
ncbi:MAG: hypothetical protein GC204_03575 [Chloroflexi bacterium]|nr:hypothetical protein [Chloroflexota bacterium]